MPPNKTTTSNPCRLGERLVFEPYTNEAHTRTFDWIARHGTFADAGMGHSRYEGSVSSLQAGGDSGSARRNPCQPKDREGPLTTNSGRLHDHFIYLEIKISQLGSCQDSASIPIEGRWIGQPPSPASPKAEDAD